MSPSDYESAQKARPLSGSQSAGGLSDHNSFSHSIINSFKFAWTGTASSSTGNAAGSQAQVGRSSGVKTSSMPWLGVRSISRGEKREKL